MTRADLERFRALLKVKHNEVSGISRRLETIAIERSPELMEELQYKSDREIAIVGLNRDTAIRRDIELALMRINDNTFGSCAHCDQDISQRRLQAVPWTPFCVRCQEAADRGDESVLESVEPAFFDAA
jgi:DnaK suppressor protein